MDAKQAANCCHSPEDALFIYFKFKSQELAPFLGETGKRVKKALQREGREVWCGLHIDGISLAVRKIQTES